MYSYVFLSATNFGNAVLEALVQKGHIPKAIFSIPQEFCISYSKTKVKNSNFYDFTQKAKELEIPIFWVESPKKTLESYAKELQEFKVDFMLVAGWYYKIPKKIYSLSKMGSFGFHNSILPNYAGGAPLVWAIINGESKSGVTLFQMEEEMDTGDIIFQEEFEISYNDSIAEVLKKAEKCAINMSLKLFSQKEIRFIPQNAKPKYYPQRNENDGELDLSLDSTRLYNFIRAQSSPYPGAFIKTTDGKRLVIQKAYILDSAGGGGIFVVTPFVALKYSTRRVA